MRPKVLLFNLPSLSPGVSFETDWMTQRAIAYIARKYKEAVTDKGRKEVVNYCNIRC
jgi:hypothetical protein